MDNTIEITATQAREWINQGVGQLVDVRFPEETEISGSLVEEISLPLSVLQRFCGVAPAHSSGRLAAAHFMVAERTGLVRALIRYADQKKALLCLCRSGNRSLTAAHLLREIGFARAYSVIGGIESWAATSGSEPLSKASTTDPRLPGGAA